MSAYEKINILKLSIPGKLSYFPIAQFFVQETANMFGFEGDDLYKKQHIYAAANGECP